MDAKTKISLYCPGYLPEVLGGWIEQQFNAGMTATEIVDIIITLHHNNIYFGGGGAAPVWAVKKAEPNDAILRLDPLEHVLFECAAPPLTVNIEKDDRTDKEVLDDALNAAVKVIQDHLGVTTGDYAGVHFSGGGADGFKAIMQRYLDGERLYQGEDAPIQGKDPFGLDQFPLNTVVRFKADYDQFPETVVKAGETGTVVVIDENEPIGTVMLSIELDRFHNSLLEWKNQVHVTIEKGEDIHTILERVS
jgi:hypothetical protein